MLERRSFCLKCEQQLRWYELIPVISYLIAKGKCKHCGGRISLQYPLIELLAGVVAVIIVYRYGISLQSIELLFYFLLMLIVAIIDWKFLIIPNQIVIAGLVGGFVLKGLAGTSLFINSLIGSLAAFAILFSIRMLGNYIFKKPSMGLGDIKLAAVLGLFLGFQNFLISLWLAAIFGSLYGIFLKIRQKNNQEVSIDCETALSGSAIRIPLGSFLSVSSYIVVLIEEEFHSISNCSTY